MKNEVNRLRSAVKPSTSSKKGFNVDLKAYLGQAVVRVVRVVVVRRYGAGVLSPWPRLLLFYAGHCFTRTKHHTAALHSHL
jgi:hypothetical protein